MWGANLVLGATGKANIAFVDSDVVYFTKEQ